MSMGNFASSVATGIIDNPVPLKLKEAVRSGSLFFLNFQDKLTYDNAVSHFDKVIPYRHQVFVVRNNNEGFTEVVP